MTHPVVLKVERARAWRDHLRSLCRTGPSRQRRQQVILVAQVITAVCEYYGITPEELSRKTRDPEIVRARQVAMHLARRMTDSSRPRIGQALGGFDSTTVLHAERKVEAMLSVNPEVQTDVDTIAGAVLSGW